MEHPAGAAGSAQSIANRLQLRVEPFSKFEELVRIASGGEERGEAPTQVRYLRSYLKAAPSPAKSVLVEKPYVDRHWLEEYTGYYATALHPPDSKATRLHVFSREFDDDGFAAILRRAVTEGPEKVEAELGDDYLGFVVVRPLPSAPIGRTVLRPTTAIRTDVTRLRKLRTGSMSLG